MTASIFERFFLAEFTCLTYGSIHTLQMTLLPWISGLGFLLFIAKLWQKMKKNLLHKCTDESSVKSSYGSISEAGEFSHRQKVIEYKNSNFTWLLSVQLKTVSHMKANVMFWWVMKAFVQIRSRIWIKPLQSSYQKIPYLRLEKNEQGKSNTYIMSQILGS